MNENNNNIYMREKKEEIFSSQSSLYIFKAFESIILSLPFFLSPTLKFKKVF